MFRLNIFVGLLSILGGLGNLFVGYKYNEEIYSPLYAALALTQVWLALIVVITGMAKAKWYLSSEVLSRLHASTAFTFYIFVFFVVAFMVPYVSV